MDELLERQRQEIEQLRERVRQLEDILAPPGTPIPLEWRLTGKEARVFAHLTTRDVATKESIMLALYSDRADEGPEMKIVDVFICKMRKKIEPFGVTINTVWGTGYSLANRADFHALRAAA